MNALRNEIIFNSEFQYIYPSHLGLVSCHFDFNTYFNICRHTIFFDFVIFFMPSLRPPNHHHNLREKFVQITNASCVREII